MQSVKIVSEKIKFDESRVKVAEAVIGDDTGICTMVIRNGI